MMGIIIACSPVDMKVETQRACRRKGKPIYGEKYFFSGLVNYQHLVFSLYNLSLLCAEDWVSHSVAARSAALPASPKVGVAEKILSLPIKSTIPVR